MNKFPEPDKAPVFFTGRPVQGAFECDCGKVSTQATHDSREQRLYWTCPDGHENSISFRL
jgi:lysyl-tRNA synthetase class I